MHASHLSFASALLLTATAATATALPRLDLTPRSNSFHEQLPSGDYAINFTVSDDDWMDRVRLSRQLTSVASIFNQASSGRPFQIVAPFSELPVGTFTVPAGDWINFYQDKAGEWKFAGHNIRLLEGPNTATWTIPWQDRTLATLVTLRNGKHAGEIELPYEPRPFDTVMISNEASGSSSVLARDTLFPKSRLVLHSGDKQQFVYDPAFRKWKLIFSTSRPVPPEQAAQRPTAPRTTVTVTDSAWAARIKMPTITWERDRRVVRSLAAMPSQVEANEVYNGAPLSLRKGDEYEFVYTEEVGGGTPRWHMLRYPTRRVNLYNLQHGKLADADSVLTWLTAGNGTRNATVTLPPAGDGARVVIDNTSDKVKSVTGPGLDIEVLPREQVSLRVDGKGNWVRQTVTIDLLFALTEHHGNVGTKEEALALMKNSLALTNQALDNSGAAFRFREAGSTVVAFGDVTSAMARALAKDATVQAERDRVGADGIYYAGTGTGCSATYRDQVEQALVAATSLLCPETTLRETLGKTLGLAVGERRAIPMIGSGNVLALYPTRERFVDDGNRAVNEGQGPQVPQMDKQATVAAGYR